MKRPRILNASFVRTVTRPGRYGDGRGGHGLSMLVKPMSNGRLSKSWAQRLRINGKPVNIGLGAFPVVTLAEARQKALDNRRTVAQGGDPRGGGMPTFAQATEKVIALHAKGWKGHVSERQWRNSLATYAFPHIGRKRVDKIMTADVMRVLLADDLWNTKRETARRVRQRIGAVMKWAVAQGYREDNPAGDAIGAALPRNGNRKEHFRSLPHSEVAEALAKVRGSGAWIGTKLAIEFLVLTATRPGETRLATWDEIDLDAATWTIPPDRMKAGRAHRVPLSRRALEVLTEALEIRNDTDLLFPSVTGKAAANVTYTKLLRELEIPAVSHGFRSSFRVWCGDTGVDREVAERALAHTVRNPVEAAYNRGTLFERRREVMRAWGRYIAPIG
ncbi:MAG: tyrosine-type recombinase/integrase [Gemmatimonadetes bacterium]|nr:tyrosine-type recombinase/integrase [Gemmatimonadota bacterium]MYA42594.1 tyrosine-type recombinase/integrase [Gemmatimonadota bacterium]MYE95191.1 tyrosine-type recombinase/integrase [Gemmatimonadota bacterium]MYJ09231.1 tyrosine-type recombinase/integrase [Gemmatimonadota bacterium]